MRDGQMIEPGRNRHLAAEPVEQLRLGGDFGCERSQRYLALQCYRGAVDPARRSITELGNQPVVSDSSACQGIDWGAARPPSGIFET
jgi:hypothetical protein